MRKTINIILAGMALLVVASCIETIDPADGDAAQSELIVVIDSEDGTKATLTDPRGSDVAGLFAFSYGDKIKVFDGTGTYVGTTWDNTNEALFSVEKPFNKEFGSGWVVFPADIVTSITASSISITLPTSYTFSEVGSTDAATCKAPVPMIGSYSGGNKVTLKQAGAVVRFRIPTSEIGEGNVSFSFGNNVTGPATISSPTPGTSTYPKPSTTAGPTITVSISLAEWEAIKDSEYAYFTLPVPEGTVINNSNKAVLATYSSINYSKMTTIKPASPLTLFRAQGYRASASFDTSVPEFRFKIDAEGHYVVIAPGNLMAHISEYHYDEDSPAGGYATADEWKFGGYLEYVGGIENAGNYLFANAGMAGSASATALIGKWVDLFSWQGVSVDIKAHGLVNYYTDGEDRTLSNNAEKWHGNVAGETVYTGCWETKPGNPSTDLGDYIHISNGGAYSWRTMTSSEWYYLLNSRTGSTIGTTSGARHGRVTIAGVCGLLVFPDGITWRTTEQGGSANCGTTGLNTAMTAIADDKGVPTNLNVNGSSYYDFTISYDTADMATMAQAGIIFLPSAGYRFGNKIGGPGHYGYYWSSQSTPGTNAKYYADYLIFNMNLVQANYPYHRFRGRSVRLVRDVE